ncbi:phage tail tube protein gp19, putative [Geotalea daltonii FRC-32]|uniref:Phage tail tube protein gp19, putative n=1 Tax=Geotalea daltonii (strain DSM 22248 / JCM 15807 / FRC-32) TaxID=316067 RepID=B9M9C3_GEODF|nr:phage tail protein [Geotalea daltonii]ACM18681.1 phage tail tube protein gp19, putative [Geotalea daltonii FRC-32]
MDGEMPFPQFRYLVESHGIFAGFSQVTLDQEDLSLHDREKLKLQTANLVLSSGMLTFGTDLYKWLCSVKPQTIERRTISITLHNDTHQKIAAWQVSSAFPVKVRGLQLKSSGHEVVIELIEVEHRGIELIEQL